MKNSTIRIVLPFHYTIGEIGVYTGREIETAYDASCEALENISQGLEMPEVEQDDKYDLRQQIDWVVLKKQKEDLLKVIDENSNSETKDSLTGILNLIDSIQDHAVDVMGMSEKIVFNLEDEE